MPQGGNKHKEPVDSEERRQFIEHVNRQAKLHDMTSPFESSTTKEKDNNKCVKILNKVKKTGSVDSVESEKKFSPKTFGGKFALTDLEKMSRTGGPKGYSGQVYDYHNFRRIYVSQNRNVQIRNECEKAEERRKQIEEERELENQPRGRRRQPVIVETHVDKDTTFSKPKHTDISEPMSPMKPGLRLGDVSPLPQATINFPNEPNTPFNRRGSLLSRISSDHGEKTPKKEEPK